MVQTTRLESGLVDACNVKYKKLSGKIREKRLNGMNIADNL